jgi:hypothetical protein
MKNPRRLVAVALLILAHSVFGQDAPPSALYDERGRMISITHLLADEQRTCARFVYVGAVSRVEYDGAGHLVGFTVKPRRGSAQHFALLYLDSLTPSDHKQLPTLIKRGARLRVAAYGCGASAAVREADEITAP